MQTQELATEDALVELKEFFQHHSGEISENHRIGKYFVYFPFFELAQLYPDVAEALLDRPTEILDMAELALKEVLQEKINHRMIVRFIALPKICTMVISHLRNPDHIGKFITVEGLVKSKTNVKGKIIQTEHECIACGNKIPILQFEDFLKEPTICACGKRGKMKLINKKVSKLYSVVLEETDNPTGELKKVHIILDEDLAEPKIEQRIYHGLKIRVNGVFKDKIIIKKGIKSSYLDSYIHANSIEFLDMQDNLDLTQKDEEQINTISANPFLANFFSEMIFPDIEGYDTIKKAIVLQMFSTGMVEHKGSRTRDFLNILLIGDTGVAKSKILKRTELVHPKARYGVGASSSGRGLCAAVVRDELLGIFTVEAGLLPLSHKGIALIDEFDKLSDDDKVSLHEALENGTVTVTKVAKTTLKCETAVLAAANPKFGIFDSYKTPAEQLDLPPTIINRFDLIFPIRDIANPETDGKIFDLIFQRYVDGGQGGDLPLDPLLMKKYIYHATKIQPVIPKELQYTIKDFYLKLRAKKTQEQGFTSYSISARQLESIFRLSRASARMKLSNVVSKSDVNLAQQILEESLKEVGFDPQTGQVDITKINQGIGTHSIAQNTSIRDIIRELSDKTKLMPFEVIRERCSERGISDSRFEEVLTKLLREGCLHEPKPGYYELLGFI